LQEVALKYRARGWPALWKIASALDHLDTRYLSYPLYFSIESSQPLRSNSTGAGMIVQNRFFWSHFDAAKPCANGTIVDIATPS